ncbi:MAG: hypothetical protein K0R53_3098 [Burkholderiales bacterium]|jgi:hypothetical protein|nr:hypothetical protein [Burkholderiales bacterium]
MQPAVCIFAHGGFVPVPGNPTATSFNMLKYFPHFWINRRADARRRHLIEAYFADSGIEHARIEAVTPETLPKVSVRTPLANSMAELSIFTSHLAAIDAALQSGCEAAVVMEDDVRSRHVFDGAAIVASAPADWEVLQLHVSNRPVVLALGDLFLRHGVLWHEWEPHFYSAGAYVVSRKGAENILARYRPEGRQIDLGGVHAFGKLVADHLLYRRSRCYTATIPFFMNDTDLTSTHAPNRDETHHRPGAAGVESVMQAVERRAREAGRAYPFALGRLAEKRNDEATAAAVEQVSS